MIFESEMRSKADLPFSSGVKNLETAYRNSLDTALKNHATNGNLDEALALKEELQAFSTQGTLPESDAPETSSEIKRLRMAWRVEMNRLHEQRSSAMKPVVEAHATRLRGLILELTKKMKLDEAKKVKERLTTVLAMENGTLVIQKLPVNNAVKPLDAKLNPAVPAEKSGGTKTGDQKPGDTVAINSLPEEDQKIVNGLKFANLELAPLDTRHWTYIKGRVQVTNSSSRHTITDKIQVESRMLCRNNDNEWSIIHSVAGLDIADKGQQFVEFSFPVKNQLFTKYTGDIRAPLFDSYTKIRYGGITIAVFHSKPELSDPKDWWKGKSLADFATVNDFAKWLVGTEWRRLDNEAFIFTAANKMENFHESKTFIYPCRILAIGQIEYGDNKWKLAIDHSLKTLTHPRWGNYERVSHDPATK